MSIRKLRPRYCARCASYISKGTRRGPHYLNLELCKHCSDLGYYFKDGLLVNDQVQAGMELSQAIFADLIKRKEEAANVA